MSRHEHSVVTFVTTSRHVWGAESSLLQNAAAMSATGISCGLITVSPDLASRWRNEVNDEVTVLPASRTRVRDVARFAHAIITRRSKVIVAFDLNVVPALALRRILPFRAPRLVIDLHNVLSDERGLRRLRFFARFLHKCVAVSNYSASQVADVLETTVVHRPIGPQRRHSFDASTPVQFGVVGRLDHDKGIDLALAALRELEPSVHLVIRGDPSAEPQYAENLRREAEETLPGRVHFQPKAPPGKVLDGIDILIFLNSREPSGRIIAEAQVAGIPVIAPDQGGAAEFVREGVTGWKYRANDALALAGVWRDVSRMGLHSLSRTCSAVATKEYDVDVLAAAYASAVLPGGTR